MRFKKSNPRASVVQDRNFSMMVPVSEKKPSKTKPSRGGGVGPRMQCWCRRKMVVVPWEKVNKGWSESCGHEDCIDIEKRTFEREAQ